MSLSLPRPPSARDPLFDLDTDDERAPDSPLLCPQAPASCWLYVPPAPESESESEDPLSPQRAAFARVIANVERRPFEKSSPPPSPVRRLEQRRPPLQTPPLESKPKVEKVKKKQKKKAPAERMRTRSHFAPPVTRGAAKRSRTKREDR